MRPHPYERLLPAPREVTPTAGALVLAPGARVRLETDDATPPLARERIARPLRELGLEVDPAGETHVRVTTGEAADAEGYELVVRSEGILLRGAGSRGTLHGASTLGQLLTLAAPTRALRCASVQDAPAFARRGWMLDVSRDRVPTLPTLMRLVDLLASLKGNELQLYVEHTFAYAGHEEVWRGTGALTPDDVRTLDAYCAERGVELVPNQNCLGHLHHWLVHPRYRPLAEVPEGVEHPFAREPEPFSLCPTDPRSLALVGELLDQLLPCFRSRDVNVGLDETFDLGRGRSREAAERLGVGRVYLDHLRGVHRLVTERGHRMQFWADVLLEHPELVPEVPRDALALLWGYEAAHPFDQEAARVAASGLPFSVCPGTSSWQSFGGRTANMRANVAAALDAARAHGARGVLIADWGDRGHLQPEWASYAGWTLASALAWNDAPPQGCDPRDEAVLAAHLDTHVFADAARVLGGVALELGRAGEVTGARAPNASALSLLLTAFERPFPPPALEGLTAEGLEAAVGHVDATLARLPAARSARDDAGLIADELVWVGGLQRWTARLGLARLHAGGPLEGVAAEVRGALADELAALADEHRRLWRARCRPEGLERSVEWLERLGRALTD